MLILDEPTSHLDRATEARVMDAIRPLMATRATLVISHRMRAVQHANEIIVLREGAIVERGRHEALLAQHGLY